MLKEHEFIDGYGLDCQVTPTLPPDQPYDETTDGVAEIRERITEAYHRFMAESKEADANAMAAAMIATLMATTGFVLHKGAEDQARRAELEQSARNDPLPGQVQQAPNFKVIYYTDKEGQKRAYINIFPNIEALKNAPNQFQKDWAFSTMAIWGEGRGEGTHGMHAIASVIQNRVKSKRWGDRAADVVLADEQFSCMNDGDPNKEKMDQMIENDRLLLKLPASDPRVQNIVASQDYQKWLEAKQLAFKMLNGHLRDIVHGAIYYHRKDMKTRWDKEMNFVQTIGAHSFFTPKAKKHES